MKRDAYMCGVDFQHELDPDQPHFVKIYSSVEHLKRERTCWKNCGIVKVTVEVQEWVNKQDFSRCDDES